MLNTSIVLDLSDDEPRDAHPMPADGLVQRAALQALRERVRAQLRDLPPFRSESDLDMAPFTRPHNAILVDGARGTGKTTFLLTVQQLIRDGRLFPDEPQSAAPKSLVDLGIIDPTLIEVNEHLFINLIARIKRLVDKHHDEADGDRRSERDYLEWEKALLRLAGGLTLLGGAGGSTELAKDAWEDPTFVLQQGLRNAKHGGDLERRFHAFIDHSLQYLGKQGFFLAFDDVDTDFAQGIPILNVIRRYLTAPRLIIVVSGDLALYSSMVRKTQWENLGQLPLAYEARERYEPLVDQLEEQFLLKLLKPENRITLEPLKELYKQIHVTLGEAEDRVDLETVYGNLIEEAFAVRSWKDRGRYLDVFLRQPLRTNIQVLRLFGEVTVWTWRFAADDEEGRKHFLTRLASIFASTLTLRGFAPASLKDPTYGALASYLASQNLLQNAYRLRPEFRDERLNTFLVVLSAFYTDDMRRNPASYLDYFIKVCLPREVLVGDVRTAGATEASFRDTYLDFVGGGMDEDAIQVARKHSAYFPADAAHPGVVPARANSAGRRPVATLNAWLFGTSEPTKDEGSSVPTLVRSYVEHMGFLHELGRGARLSHTPASLESALTSWHRGLASILFSNNLDRYRNSAPKASIFNLFGFLSVALHAHTERDIRQALATYAQIRDFPTFLAPDAAQPRSRDADAEREEAWRPDESTPADDTFFEAMVAWKRLGARCEPLPVHVVAKVWTRFYYTLMSIEQDLTRGEAFLGYMMHRYIVAFLHAALVETMLHHDVAPREIRNPVSSDQAFLRNLRSNEAGPLLDPERPTFFTFMFACPIWTYYLAPDKDDSVYAAHRDLLRRAYWSLDFPEQDDVLLEPATGERLRLTNLFEALNAVMLAKFDRTPRRETEEAPPPVNLPSQLSKAIKQRDAFLDHVRAHRAVLKAHFGDRPITVAAMHTAITSILGLGVGSRKSKSFDEAAHLIVRELKL